jgi:hypothetical protein
MSRPDVQTQAYQLDVTTNLGGSEIRTQNRFEFGLGARRKSELVTVTNSDLPQGMLGRAADRKGKRRQLERGKARPAPLSALAQRSSDRLDRVACLNSKTRFGSVTDQTPPSIQARHIDPHQSPPAQPQAR